LLVFLEIKFIFFSQQSAETRSWDSTIEILGISDIRTSVEGLSKDLETGDRLSLVVDSVVKLKSLPKCSWKAYTDGAFEISPSGELRALTPGHGVIIAQHNDERNNIYRESVSIFVYLYIQYTPFLSSKGEQTKYRHTR
jgi:hypothetical protein